LRQHPLDYLAAAGPRLKELGFRQMKMQCAVEYMPWSPRLFEETPAIEDGCIVVPDKPWLGLAFNRQAIKQYQVAWSGDRAGRASARRCAC
jgi:hypothetical protein